jgi:hypothetical protein
MNRRPGLVGGLGRRATCCCFDSCSRVKESID